MRLLLILDVGIQKLHLHYSSGALRTCISHFFQEIINSEGYLSVWKLVIIYIMYNWISEKNKKIRIRYSLITVCVGLVALGHINCISWHINFVSLVVVCIIRIIRVLGTFPAIFTMSQFTATWASWLFSTFSCFSFSN